MQKTYVLIDFENVQPVNFFPADDIDCKLLVFIGANQRSAVARSQKSLIRFGDQAECIPTIGSSKNSLDFHLVCYLGGLVKEDPAGLFYIISKDQGYDSLISHLNQHNFFVRRVTCISHVPGISLTKEAVIEQVPVTQALEDNWSVVMLSGLNRPRSLDGLKNAIITATNGAPSNKEVDDMIGDLITRHALVISDSGDIDFSRCVALNAPVFSQGYYNIVIDCLRSFRIRPAWRASLNGFIKCRFEGLADLALINKIIDELIIRRQIEIDVAGRVTYIL